MTASEGGPDVLGDYFAALQRLVAGKPQVVPKGTRITNDAVALEAGRGKGSIKKSRSMFGELIAAIEAAAQEQARPRDQARLKFERAKADAERYRRELEAALSREVSLLKELYETKLQLARITGAGVVPLRGGSASRGKKL